ncbi:MAG: hypothetical protein ACK4KT_02490 [Thermaurantimonas sp.]
MNFTTIGFEKEFEGNATVEVFNMMSQSKLTIANKASKKGYSEIKWKHDINLMPGFHKIKVSYARAYENLMMIRK